MLHTGEKERSDQHWIQAEDSQIYWWVIGISRVGIEITVTDALSSFDLAPINAVIEVVDDKKLFIV